MSTEANAPTGIVSHQAATGRVAASTAGATANRPSTISSGSDMYCPVPRQTSRANPIAPKTRTCGACEARRRIPGSRMVSLSGTFSTGSGR